MRRSAIFFTLALIVVIGGAFFGYDYFFNRKELKAWDVVPTDAILVYERSQCGECVTKIQQSTLWQILREMLLYQRTDSLRAMHPLLKDELPSLVSLHRTKKDALDLIFYLDPGLLNVGTEVLKTSGWKSRTFNEITIFELAHEREILSVAQLEKVWVASYSSILIEDVIRTAIESPGRLKSSAFPQSFSTIKEDGGNLYIQLTRLNELTGVFSPTDATDVTLGKSAILDVRGNERQLVLNGFSLDSTRSARELLTIFRRQSPATLRLEDLIPNRAVAVRTYGITDGDDFASDLRAFQLRHKKEIVDSMAVIEKRFNIQFQQLTASIINEIDVLSLESRRADRTAKMVLIQTASTAAWKKAAEKLADQLSLDTVFYERYGDFEIREVPLYKFTEKLLWPLVTGFKQNYYTTRDNVILIAENLEELKQSLDEMELEDTWGKSVAKNRYLESTLLEANLSIYLNPQRAWALLQDQLHPRWRNFAKDHRAKYRALDMISLQFSHLNNNYYTNALITFDPWTGKEEPERQPFVAVSNFQNGIMSMHAVKSHVSRSSEILMQDSLHGLSLLSAEGKTLWSMSLNSPIVSEIHQIDYFRNGKLQYLIATANALHLIDRLGSYVDGFPIQLPLIDIEHISVVDYDNSKRYRFLVSEKNGKIWMFDKLGNPLEGWSPNDVGGSLAMPARHHRIRGRDYIIALQRNGSLHIMNRRGELLRHFPVNTASSPSGDYFLEPGSTAENSALTFVSSDGFKIRVGLDGKVQSREALAKTSVSSSFSLITEKADKQYLVLQQDGRQSTLSDQSGKIVLTTPIGGLQPSDVKYYDFGGGRSFIVARDRVQSFVYVFDGSGSLLTEPPLEGNTFELINSTADRASIILGFRRALTTQVVQQ